jgi:hypothetical protein
MLNKFKNLNTISDTAMQAIAVVGRRQEIGIIPGFKPEIQ